MWEDRWVAQEKFFLIARTTIQSICPTEARSMELFIYVTQNSLLKRVFLENSFQLSICRNQEYLLQK